jgi:hypothetical protein
MPSTSSHVRQSADGTFWVINATVGPFLTNEAAWRYVDTHSDEGRADTDRYNWLRIVFSKCGARP